MTRDRTLPDGWRWVRFGDVIRQVKDKIDPETAGIDRYVAGEHMDTDDLRIRRWGDVGEGYLGPAFHMRFKPGQVLYGSRRTYLRKVAVADFEGICANTTFIIEPSTDELLPGFLPLVMTTGAFHEHSIKQSKGSVNPYINFRDLTWYEFALPPVAAQSQLADDFAAVDEAIAAVEAVTTAADELREATSHALFADAGGIPSVHLTELVKRPIQYGVLKPGPEFPGGVRCVDVKNYPDGEIKVESVRSIDPAIEREFQRSKLRTGDLLVSVRGTIGRIAKVPSVLDGANISRDSARVSLAEGVDPEYIRVVLESADAQREMRGKVVGLAVKGINIADLRRVPIPLPPLEVQKNVARRSESIRSLKSAAARQSADLRRLRGGLLTHLLQGAS